MLTVIGCGNSNRNDDGVGVVVVQKLIERLRRHPIPGVQAFDCGTAGLEVMFAARGSDALYIIDACSTQSEPGTIFEVPGEVLSQDHAPTYSLHDFRWDHALAAGKKIYGEAFPKDIKVWLVEAESLGFGLELTPSVQQAADTVYSKLLDAIASYTVKRHANQDAVTVHIRRGSIHLTKELVELYFGTRQCVVLFYEQDCICLMPVEQMAGGLLLKQRNAHGDRAVDASEFLRLHEWDEWNEYECQASWDSQLGTLAIRKPGATK
ncbi:MAG: hypothetical protein CL920_04915 [Deltaproteobacteria bacterium]|nr:hypothetical protein [Deltaproteobacteria bacterium]|tara:strand:+ start:30277 stop:31071 length:795 start_codon:yes stop_codon:yes gene_type:complete